MIEVPAYIGASSPKDVKEAEKMTKAIFGSVSKAIYQTYPEASRFKGDVTRGEVHFTTVENILSIQRKSTPKQNLHLYQALAEVFQQCGLPETGLEKWRYKTSEEKPHFTNYEEGVVYLPHARGYNLLSSNRIEAAKELGNTLIEEAIKTYGYRVGPKIFEPVPWNFFWGFMMDHDLDDFYGSWGKQIKNKKDRMRFREARKGISFFSQTGIEQEEVQFWAAGVKVLAVRKDQSLMSAEYILGEDFDDGTVQSLAEPVKKRFLELLGEKLDIKVETGDGSGWGKTEKQKRAEVVHEVMGLKGKKLFSAYVDSKFPLDYMRSNNPRLDPFRYPEVFVELD